ncbi:MAG TPA: DivIVA domain-containing protein [Solirubrobacterales bacterium]|nr:DivIVA domain-containing protein [Solirubrobacterales bacterium]
MELDRHQIERKDFTVARRGYDQEEVDLHLRQLADTVGELRAQLTATPAGVAGAAAEQVRQIVEAAEESAAQIERRANEEARRVTEDASHQARDTREAADRDAADQLGRVQETAAKIIQHADALQSELDTLTQSIREEAAGLVERLRSATGQLDGELGSMRSELLAARPAPEEGEAAAAPERPGWPSAAERAGAGVGAAGAPEGDAEREGAAEPVTATAAGERMGAEPASPGTPGPSPAPAGPEGARLVALNMALNGTPREETARYLADNFQLEDREAILDDVYSRVGSRG